MMLTARPQAVGYGAERTRRPAWPRSCSFIRASRSGLTAPMPRRAPTKDQVLDDFTLYWLTQQRDLGGAAVLGEQGTKSDQFAAIVEDRPRLTLPVAVTHVRRGRLSAVRSHGSDAPISNLIYFHQTAKAAHFAAWEQPQLFAD